MNVCQLTVSSRSFDIFSSIICAKRIIFLTLCIKNKHDLRFFADGLLKTIRKD